MIEDERTEHFKPVQVLLPSEEVARRLAHAIRFGFFKIGSRLPSERSLAEQMQVSRPTVREAIKLLVATKNLTLKPGAGGGTFVASEIVPLDFMVDTPSLRPGEVDDAVEARRLILPWVVRIASQYAEDEDFERMRSAIAFGRAALPPETVAESNAEQINSIIIATMRFDMALARATRNGLVVRLMEMLLQWVEPLRYKTLETRADLLLALELIEEMFRAVEQADPDKISAITERRLSILETALEKKTGRRLRRRRRPVA